MLNTSLSNIEFTDLLDLKTIQKFQDTFSDATGIASVITKVDGTPITKPTNFCTFCSLIRQTEKGLENCSKSATAIGKQLKGGPMFHKCLSGGLWDAGANISVKGQNIAIWLIGQVYAEETDENEILEYARDIGADENELMEELKKVTRMPLKQFEKILNLLHIFANELSNKAYQNLQLKIHKEHLEILVNEKTQKIEATIQELKIANEQLKDKNNIINQRNISLNTALQQLKEAQAQIIQSEKLVSLGILTEGVAHEINNPLNFIMGAYYGLEKIHSQKSYEQNSEKLSVLIDALKTGVDRITTIVSGLNEFSHDSTSHNEKCDLHAIIDNCLAMLYNQTKHRISINKNYEENNLIINGNSSNLHQVFLNILLNSIQAIPKKGEITIKTISQDSNVEILFADDGEGISSENLKKITDPFFTTKEPGKGTGLGLSISYKIIKEHNGILLFYSELGKGTLVTIKLPKMN